MKDCNPYIWRFVPDSNGPEVWLSTYPHGMEDAGEITILAGYG